MILGNLFRHTFCRPNLIFPQISQPNIKIKGKKKYIWNTTTTFRLNIFGKYTVNYHFVSLIFWVCPKSCYKRRKIHFFISKETIHSTKKCCWLKLFHSLIKSCLLTGISDQTMWFNDAIQEPKNLQKDGRDANHYGIN